MPRSAACTADRANLGPGLFINRQIARVPGGDMELQSRNGRVRFTMAWPKAPPP